MVKNCISGIEMWPVNRLKPFARNPKKHPEQQVSKIAASILEFGFNDPISVLPDGTIITGHGTYLAIKKLGMIEVPVTVLSHLTPDSMKAYLIAHNKTSESSWDEDQLTELLAEIDDAGIDFLSVGFTHEEMTVLLTGENFLGEDEKPKKQTQLPVKKQEITKKSVEKTGPVEMIRTQDSAFILLREIADTDPGEVSLTMLEAWINRAKKLCL
jgi:ParB-like chromosome segregation protein Spo0J